MKDQNSCSSANADRALQIYSQSWKTEEEKKAAKVGYALGHRNGYDCGWTHGYSDGVGAAGWKEQARHYLFPAVLAGAMVGWVACYFLQVVPH